MTQIDSAPPSTQARPARAAGFVELALLLLGAEVCRHLEWPWRTAGLAFAVGAVVAAVVVLVRLRRTPQGPRRRVLAGAIGLAVAISFVLGHVFLLLSGVLLREYEQCFDSALTRQARQTCEESMTQDLRDRMLGTR